MLLEIDRQIHVEFPGQDNMFEDIGQRGCRIEIIYQLVINGQRIHQSSITIK